MCLTLYNYYSKVEKKIYTFKQILFLMVGEENKKRYGNVEEDILEKRIWKWLKEEIAPRLDKISEELEEAERERKRREQELARYNVRVIRYCTDLPYSGCSCDLENELREWINLLYLGKLVIIDGNKYEESDVYKAISCLLPKDEDDFLRTRLYDISKVDRNAYSQVFETIRTLSTDPALSFGRFFLVFYKPGSEEKETSIIQTLKTLYSLTEEVRKSGEGRLMSIVYLPPEQSSSLIERIGEDEYLREERKKGLVEIVR